MGLTSGLGTWCFWTVVLEKTLESPLDSKEIQPVHPKGNQSWIFIGRTDAEAETPILWPPDSKNWFMWKDPDAGKDWRWEEEKGMTEDEMVGRHHRLDGHEFEQAPGVGDGQGSLVFHSQWFCKESDRTKQLYWTELGTKVLHAMQHDQKKKNQKKQKNCETPFPFPKPCYSLFFSLLTVSYWHLPWDLQNYYSEKKRQSFCFPKFVTVKVYYFLFYFSGAVLTCFC